MNNIIEIKDITKVYGTKVKTSVLKGINLNIKEGSFNWITGSSGSGKTTLLNIISGLDDPTSGDVYINGVKMSELSENSKADFRAKNLGFVFQFHYLLPEFRAIENVLIPLRIQKTKITKEVKLNAIDLMTSIGLENVYNNYPREMSGGEQQRTAIARAIISNPSLVIADEPTGNLDSKTASEVYMVIRALHKRFNMTFIIVTHDEIKPEKGDRLINISDGKISKDIIY